MLLKTRIKKGGPKRKISFKSYQVTKKVKLYALNITEPTDYYDIFTMKDKDLWIKAINEELESLKNMNVYIFVNKVPKGSNIVTCRWVLKYKRDPKGNIIKRKARIVARGFSQRYGVDFWDTFSPTLKLDSLRIIIAISVQKGFIVEQIDVNSAYLNADLEEDIYMVIPEGHPLHGKGYWKLRKALYGLKQAGKAWNDKINEVLINFGFKRVNSEPCIYVKFSNAGELICILALYVDDILISGNKNEIKITKELIKSKFNIKELGEVNFIIGIKFEKCNDGYFIHQKRYICDILKKYNVEDYKPARSPRPIKYEDLTNKKFNEKIYRSAVGSLLYLAICTRPDILFSVNKAARKSNDPNYEDWEGILKIFKYLKYTLNYGIKFTKNTNINVFTDADYAGDELTRRSTSGFLITIGNAPTSWLSKLQHSVSTSTAEAEYYSLGECAKHCVWYINFLNELKYNIKYLTINIDNKAAIHNGKNQSINSKNKHIDIRFHYIRELIKDGKIKLRYIKSRQNLADGLTKFLNGPMMDTFRRSILVKDSDILRQKSN